jgi:hypothetical protein
MLRPALVEGSKGEDLSLNLSTIAPDRVFSLLLGMSVFAGCHVVFC